VAGLAWLTWVFSKTRSARNTGRMEGSSNLGGDLQSTIPNQCNIVTTCRIGESFMVQCLATQHLLEIVAREHQGSTNKAGERIGAAQGSLMWLPRAGL